MQAPLMSSSFSFQAFLVLSAEFLAGSCNKSCENSSENCRSAGRVLSNLCQGSTTDLAVIGQGAGRISADSREIRAGFQ